jgi:ClpP class serine protease
VAFAKDLMDKLHVRFKDWVRTRRGGRLKAPDGALFDGGYMLGEQALASGLIDGFATVDELVHQLGGDRARSRRIAPKRSRLALRLPRLAVDTLLDALEDRVSRITLR